MPGSVSDPVRLDLFQTIREVSWKEKETETETETATGSEFEAPFYAVVQATANGYNAGPGTLLALPFTMRAIFAGNTVYADNRDDVPPGSSGGRTTWLRPGAADPGAGHTVMSIGPSELENYYAIALTGLSAEQDFEHVGNQTIFLNIRALVEDGVVTGDTLPVSFAALYTGVPSQDIGVRIQTFAFGPSQTSVTFGQIPENPSGAISGGQILWRAPSGSQIAIATTRKGVGSIVLSPFEVFATINLHTGGLI